MYGAETSLWFDQSATLIGREQTNSFLVSPSVTYEFKGTDFQEKQGFDGKKPKWNALKFE